MSKTAMWLNRALWALCAVGIALAVVSLSVGDLATAALGVVNAVVAALAARVHPNHVRMPR